MTTFASQRAMSLRFVLALCAVAAPAVAMGQLKPGATPAVPGVQPSTASVSTGAGAPGVSYEARVDGGRTMNVDYTAPIADATVERAADVRAVNWRSDTWYCERDGANAVTGAFANRVRTLLSDHLAGRALAGAAARSVAGAPNLDLFADQFISGESRVKARKFAAYPSPGSGPNELRLNDCYTVQEMQAIKTEALRVFASR